MNNEDFKVASTESIVKAISSEYLDRNKFFDEIVRYIHMCGLSYNQYSFLESVLYQTTRKQIFEESSKFNFIVLKDERNS